MSAREAITMSAMYRNQGCPYPDCCRKVSAKGLRIGVNASRARVCADEYEAAYANVAAVSSEKRIVVGRK